MNIATSVRGLEGGAVVEFGVCRCCERRKARYELDLSADMTWRVAKPMKLVHVDLADPIR